MKLTIFLLALLCATFTLSAQSSDKFTGSLLWKISGNGNKDPSYLLGTHHLISTNFVDSISNLKKIMDEVEQIAGELVMNDIGAVQARVQLAAMMPKGESYKALLTEQEYINLDRGLKEILGIGLDHLGNMKPGMLSSLYTIGLYIKMTPGFNPMIHETMDQYIQQYALKRGKTVIGLEEVEDQTYALYDSEPLKDQAVNLACAITNPEFAKESLSALTLYYKSGQLDKMYDLIFENPDDPCPSSEKFENALNKNRNNNWLEKIPQIIKEKTTLIAVGSLHLTGEEGLLFQLDKMGYNIEAVK